VDQLLDKRGEPSAQLLWALALRGDDRIESRLLTRLGDREPFERWTAALALARLLGPRSRPHLEQRGEAAQDVLERCGMLAAALRAGDASMAPRLHEALQADQSLPLLRTVWKVELLDAFRTTGTFDERAFSLWRTAAGVTPRQLQYFAALVTPALPPAAPMVVPTPAPRPRLFISYSHRDGAWLSRFQVMLRPLLDAEQLEVWDDTRIVPGKWRAQIDRAMADSHVALFLVSAYFLASEFITRHELPQLLKYVEERGLRVVWVLLDDCLWEVSALADYQGENAAQPLTLLSEGEQSRAIKKACVRIQGLLTRPA
jgi:hypothetical protein